MTKEDILRSFFGTSAEAAEESKKFMERMQNIKIARRCHCRKSLAECLCGLSWWKRISGRGAIERWNEAIESTGRPADLKWRI